ncbi:MAG: OOP family OmpA-OmpF porin [Paracoccaceae bacterium]|jgi:OOP family OmpA-OmpF porin
MTLINNILLAGGIAGLLSACSGTLIQAERAATATDPFAAALQAGYATLAREELNESDFGDANTFAIRALAAANGKPPAPENFDARKIPAETLPALVDARNKLLAVLNNGARTSLPGQAAKAQLAFDCWMQEQEENFQAGEIAACRNRFDSALGVLESKQLASAAPIRPRPTPASLKTPMRAESLTTRFLIYFDLDTASLVPGSESEITRAAAAARRSGAAMVRVTGHADRSGSERHNMSLSRARAEEVVRALRRLGLPEIGVATQAYGEEKPVVPTKDGRAEARNRRVEIELSH